jgi:hypothetical protein
MVDGGPVSSPTLLQVGDSTNNVTHKDPIFVDSVYCRVGGPANYKSTAQACFTINANDVVIDDTWLWRADHGYNVGWTVNPGDVGVYVNGKNVIAYNFMSEHFNKYQVVWNGSDGKMFEFQTEPPYDVPNQQSWMDGSRNGYTTFKITDTAKNFVGYGFGVYTNFTNQVFVDSAIEAPTNANVKLYSMIGFWLNGHNSGFRHFVNNDGCGVTSSGDRLCTYKQWP